MELDPATFATMSPQDLAEHAGRMSDRQVAEVMAGAHRRAILDAVFARFPEHFRADRAQGVSSLTRFRVTGGPEGEPDDRYEVVIDEGRCTSGPVDAAREEVEPDVSLRLGPAALFAMLTGRGNPTMMVMRGAITVRGDLAQAARFSSYFDLPKA